MKLQKDLNALFVDIKISESPQINIFSEKWSSKFVEETSVGIVNMETHVTLDMR